MNRTRRSPVTVRRDTRDVKDTRDTRDKSDRNDRSVRDSLEARSKERVVERVERVESVRQQPRPQSARPSSKPAPTSSKRNVHEEDAEYSDDEPLTTRNVRGNKSQQSQVSQSSRKISSVQIDEEDHSEHDQVEHEDHVEHHDEDHVEHHDEDNDRVVDEPSVRGKRQSSLIPKAVIAKLISEAGIEGVSSDVYPYVTVEIQEFLKHVIKSLEEEADGDELVIKDSYLKFLGDKSRATGVLDMKSFERVYGVTSESMNVNPEFSSSAFASLCKYTEIHVVDFLRKARKIVQFYGRKRLTAKDLDLLKEMLN